MLRSLESLLFLTLTGMILLSPGASLADCAPDDFGADPPPLGQPQPGGSVVCSGVDGDGFQRNGIDSLRVTVNPGASVEGIILGDASAQSLSIGTGAVVTTFRSLITGIALNAVALPRVGGGSVTNAGTVTSSVFEQPTIFLSGSNMTVDNSGTVESFGIEASAIDLQNVFTADIRNSGQIRTTGTDSNGIEGFGSALFIENSGSVQTQGDEARGIFLESGAASDSLVSAINSGGITTNGEEAQAIFVEAADATVVNDGSLTTRGFAAPAILVDGIGAVITNRSQIRTSGTLSVGMGAFQDGGKLTNSGTILATGEEGAGMQIGAALLGSTLPANSGTVLNTGSIDVSGSDAHGLLGIGTDNTLTNGAQGSITASGAASSGIQVGIPTPGLRVNANGNRLRNRGTITAAGLDGHGIFAAGSNNTLSNEGTIRVDGSNADGIGASGASNTLTNEAAGEIQVRSGAEGMRYDGNGGSADNLGIIDASASDSIGISMNGNGLTATNDGRIEVSGGGTGILMSGEEARVSNQESGVLLTTTDGSAAIWLTEGGNIQNFGEVQTFGNDASGLVVSGAGSGVARVTSDGTVSTVGSASHGIEVGRGAPATSGRVNLTGSIATEGASADGIRATVEGYDLRIGDTGGIVTAGTGADGVQLTGSGNALDHAGEIAVQGGGSAGVRFETSGGLQSFTNSGRVTSRGDAVLGSDGVEWVLQAAGGTIVGDIRLGGGSDFLTISEGSSFIGLADGGSGLVDELELETDSIDTLVGSQFVDFETFRKTGSGLLGLQETLSVDLALVERGLLAIQPGSTLQAEVGVTVSSGATLLGTGTVEGDIVVDSGGFLAPGLSIGTLEVDGNIMLGGTLEVEVGSVSLGGADLLRVLGEADLSGAEILLSFVDDYLPSVGDTFGFLEAESFAGIDGLAIDYRGLPTGYVFSLDAGPGGLLVSTDAVPEPSSLVLMMLGALALGSPRHARR